MFDALDAIKTQYVIGVISCTVLPYDLTSISFNTSNIKKYLNLGLFRKLWLSF